MAVDEQLQWEARWRMRAAVSAVAGALLMFAGEVMTGVLTRDSGPDTTSQLLYISRHGASFVLGAAVLSLGALGLILPLHYLYRATKFRRPELQRVAGLLAIFGPIAFAIAGLATQGVFLERAHSFATHGDRTYEEAKRTLQAGGLQATQGLALAGSLAVGFALVILPLNAMRVGLLTRFMGILGIIVGVLFVVRLDSPGIVRLFWFGALAYLFSGRWPNGVPPAWRSGRAEPWPSGQELREQREREAGPPAPQPEPAPAAAAPTGRPQPPSKKRKRKKRR